MMNRSTRAIRRRQRRRVRRSRGIKRTDANTLYNKIFRHIRQAQDALRPVSTWLGEEQEADKAQRLLTTCYSLLSEAARVAEKSMRAASRTRFGR